MKPNSVEDKGFRRKLNLSIVERHIGKQNEEITMDRYQNHYKKNNVFWHGNMRPLSKG